MPETLTTGSVMRAMHEDPPGVPVIAPRRNCLGVEVGYDVHPDAEDKLGPAGAGVSVVYGPQDNLRKLPKPIRPYPYGEGPFRVFAVEVPALPAEVEVKTTNNWHAVVQPRTRMLLAIYQRLLGSTQPQWKLLQLQVAS